jgi:hypothetical protein
VLNATLDVANTHQSQCKDADDASVDVTMYRDLFGGATLAWLVGLPCPSKMPHAEAMQSAHGMTTVVVVPSNSRRRKGRRRHIVVDGEYVL